jgi:hypothetical protein
VTLRLVLVADLTLAFAARFFFFTELLFMEQNYSIQISG